MSSCNNGNSNDVTMSKDEYNKLKDITTLSAWGAAQAKVFESDSCEYIGYAIGTTYGFMTHKGNCKFCQHRLEETMRKIIREELSKQK